MVYIYCSWTCYIIVNVIYITIPCVNPACMVSTFHTNEKITEKWHILPNNIYMYNTCTSKLKSNQVHAHVYLNALVYVYFIIPPSFKWLLRILKYKSWRMWWDEEPELADQKVWNKKDTDNFWCKEIKGEGLLQQQSS